MPWDGGDTWVTTRPRQLRLSLRQTTNLFRPLPVLAALQRRSMALGVSTMLIFSCMMCCSMIQCQALVSRLGIRRRLHGGSPMRADISSYTEASGLTILISATLWRNSAHPKHHQPVRVTNQKNSYGANAQTGRKFLHPLRDLLAKIDLSKLSHHTRSLRCRLRLAGLRVAFEFFPRRNRLISASALARSCLSFSQSSRVRPSSRD